MQDRRGADCTSEEEAGSERAFFEPKKKEKGARKGEAPFRTRKKDAYLLRYLFCSSFQ